MNLVMAVGDDYLPDGEDLTFSPGNTSFSVTLTLVDDDTFELTEMLQASLSFPGAAPPRVRFDPSMADITILDDDGEPRILDNNNN